MLAIPYRFRIGVTGHIKNLPDITLLKTEIRKALGITENGSSPFLHSSPLLQFFKKNIQKEIKSKSFDIPLAFTIQSALAGGADQIVAEVILEQANSKLEAIIPLALEDYKAEFKTTESQEAFNVLFNIASSKSYLRGALLDNEISGNDTESIAKRKKTKEAAFRDAGMRIVDQCDILIAIWDGKMSNEDFGTSAIVKYAKEKKCPLILISTIEKDNFKFEIEKTEYIIGDGIPFEPLKKLLYLTRISFSNKCEKEIASNNFGEFYTNDNSLIPFLTETQKEKLLNYLLPLFARSDDLAMRSKKIFEYTGTVLYILSSFAIMVVLYAILFEGFKFEMSHLSAFSIEFFILLFILILTVIANKIGFHKNWMAARFLNEKLRSAVYLFTTGVQIEKLSLSSGKFRKKLKYGWAIDAYNEIADELNSISSNQNSNFDEKRNYIKNAWIKGQLIFQRKYNAKHSRWNKNLENGGFILFAIVIVLAFTHVCYCYFHHNNEDTNFLQSLLTLGALLIIPIASALDGIRNQRGFSRNASRSESMIQILEDLLIKFDAVSNVSEFQNLMKETDKHMLRENQDWMFLMQSSELEVKP